VIVTKIGGSIARQAGPVLDDVAPIEEAVLVHGFGPQTTRVANERGVDVRWITSPDGVESRFTDEPVLDAMGRASREVADSLADGLKERDRAVARVHGTSVLEAQAKPALRHQREDGRVVLVRGDRSGRVTDVDPRPIRQALDERALPLVTPLARDDEGWVSVDADRAAAIAGRLGANSLVLLTDVDRVLDADGTPIDALSVEQARELVGDRVATGGMLRKLVAAHKALDRGVDRVLIGDGARSRPVERARAGDATEVTR